MSALSPETLGGSADVQVVSSRLGSEQTDHARDTI